VTFWTFVKSLAPTFGARHRAPDIGEVRQRCVELLADVPGVDREALMQRLEKMRRVDDMPHLRGALFDAVSHFHGEAVARDRIGTLDQQIRLFPAQRRLRRSRDRRRDP
jgi:hypothetical protein